VLKVVNEWLKNSAERNSLKCTEAKLIRPLINLALKELDSSQNDYAFKLSRVMRDLQIDLMQWESSKESNSKLFKATAGKIQYAYEKLEEAKFIL
jgi:hypothetical protein